MTCSLPSFNSDVGEDTGRRRRHFPLGTLGIRFSLSGSGGRPFNPLFFLLPAWVTSWLEGLEQRHRYGFPVYCLLFQEHPP